MSGASSTSASAASAERYECPQCQVPAGSPCRTRSGTTAAKYHTARFMLVPALRDELAVPVHADRGPSRTWQAGPALAEEAAAVCRENGGPIRIGYARCSMHTQELSTSPAFRPGSGTYTPSRPAHPSAAA